MATTAPGSVTERWILRRPPQGQRSPSSKLNAGHAIVKNLCALAAKDASSPKVAEYAELLFDQALLAEGVVEDPAKLVRRIQALLTEVSAAAVKG